MATDSPISNHEELTNDEIEAYLEDTSLTRGELERALDYEQAHKDRVGAKEAIREALEETERLTVRPELNQHYVAGIWFDDPSAFQEVERTPRVSRALETLRGGLVRKVDSQED